jgi:hypothetical protein
MPEPRNGCRGWQVSNDVDRMEELSLDEFHQLMRDSRFTKGPFKDSFGDGYGEPYNPQRQVFGQLKDGRFVYAER